MLHQLGYKLNELNINTYMVYIRYKKNNNEHMPDAFKIYGNNEMTLQDIEDNENNIIVIPETEIKYVKHFRHAKKYVWWLSVDNFLDYFSLKNVLKTIKKMGILRFIKYGVLKNKIILDKNILRYADRNLCQSYYAIHFLKKNNIEKNVYYLSDYINKTFFTNKNNLKKEDIVLYNPRKGLDFTKILISKSNQLTWIPIQGMTTEQVKEILLKSKVYIDFGNHPGKDRFPREAAMCGCCVITGKKGAAGFEKDVPICDEFKFDDEISDQNIEKIIKKIEECIKNYDEEILKFKNYKEFIKSEEEKFENDIKQNFI